MCHRSLALVYRFMLLAAGIIALLGGPATAAQRRSPSLQNRLPPPPPPPPVVPRSSSGVPMQVINAILLYPPPFPMLRDAAGIQTPQTGVEDPFRRNNSTEKMKLEINSISDNEMIVDRKTVVDVFTDDWDDMETCPHWCVNEDDGSLICCPDEDDDAVHEGDCPPKQEVCVNMSDREQHLHADRCAADVGCDADEKCCFDRCVDARVCKDAVIKG